MRTLQGEPMVTAPGKLVLLGEYAVLDGFPAIVAAVNRRATGQFVPGRSPESPLVDIAVRQAKDALGPNRSALPRGSVLVDTSAFFAPNGTKMGIGSSAATAAVSVGAVLEMAGLSVTDSTDLIFNVALASHREAQGGLGSGADVAAAVYGGILHYTRGSGPATIRRLPPLAGVEMVVFATGTPSSTVDCLQGVAAFAKASPETHRQLLPPIAEAVTRFEAGLFARDAGEIFAAIGAAHAGMDMLGQAAGVPIVTPVLAHAALLAAEVGGAAKPSGAGGGDVGIAFLPDPEAAEEFRARARDLGLGILDLFFDPTGIARI